MQFPTRLTAHLREGTNSGIRIADFLVALLIIGHFPGLAVSQSPDAEDSNRKPDAVSTHTATETMTLQELKVTGALKSSYRTPTPPVIDAAAPVANIMGFEAVVQPILVNSCVPCHGIDTTEGNIRIDTLDPDLLHGKDVDWWVEVLAVLSNGEMPPLDEGDLAANDRSKVVEWLSNELQVASNFRRTEGGHSSFRRMTRYEFNYALQDILGLPREFAKDLPPEANSEDGFQNSSEMLHMSVTQLETYRQIAREALKRAVVSGDQPERIYWGVTMEQAAKIEWPKQAEQLQKATEQFKDDPEKQKQEIDRLNASFKAPHRNAYYHDLASGRTAKANWSYHGAKYAHSPVESPLEIPKSFDHVAIIPQGRNQRLTIELGNRVPANGIMRVRVRASKSSTDAAQVPSMQLEFGWQASNEGRAAMRVSQEDTPIDAEPGSPKFYQWDFPLGDIYPRNSVRHTSKMGAMPSPSEYVRLINSSVSQGDIQLDYVEVVAPVYDEWPPASHKRIFIQSENKQDETVYAREVFNAFMSRAWRRTVDETEVDQKIKLFEAMRKNSESFEQAVVEVLATVLSSPNLIYISQTQLAEGTEGDSDRLQPHELATRLAIFLWSSVPDAELQQAANSGQLASPRALAEQVTRMLADPKATRLSQNFVHQWLDMQLLEFKNIKQQVPGFDPLLKEAMLQEPIACFDEMLRNNTSVLDFIHSDSTMANERLAAHYGLPNVRGNHFQRVALNPDDKRGGLLTQAGLLAMNSAGQDSHPLKRGVWLLESLLNDPPPPPPPAVPEIDLADPEIAKLTLKERIEDHRNHPACMSCHARIDPWGIAFENYDAVGRWRTNIKDKPVDASSLLFNNQPLDGMEGLKRFLLQNRQDQFVRALVHKLTTYALGRPLAFADRSSIEEITSEVRKQGDGLKTVILSIVSSELFQSR